jgi:hypothetical protein
LKYENRLVYGLITQKIIFKSGVTGIPLSDMYRSQLFPPSHRFHNGVLFSGNESNIKLCHFSLSKKYIFRREQICRLIGIRI